MKIGIFDSGVGGLVITKAIIDLLPQYDYHYLGDTAHLPYGDKSAEAVTGFVKQGVDYLFDQGCSLVILACNTASSEALRYLQQQYVPTRYLDSNVLGVIIPTVEAALESHAAHHIAILATAGTVTSQTYEKEIQKINPKVKVTQFAAPDLVPFIETRDHIALDKAVDEYVTKVAATHADTLILGCTHYALIKKLIRQKTLSALTVISQDEIIPDKLQQYLDRHEDYRNALTQNGERYFELTAPSEHFEFIGKEIFGESITPNVVNID